MEIHELLGCAPSLLAALMTGETTGDLFLADCGIKAVARMLGRRDGSTLALRLGLSTRTVCIVILGACGVLRSHLPQLDLLFPHGALKVKGCINRFDDETWPYLDALLVDPENRRAARVIRLTLQESLREPAVEAGIVLLLELIAIVAYAVHL